MTEAQLARRYTDRALRLILLGNGQAEDARRELRKLSGELRQLLAGVDVSSMGRRVLGGLLRDVEAAVAGRYAAIASAQLAAATELIGIEAAWAQRVSGFPRSPSARTLSTLSSGLLIFGTPLELEWRRNRDGLILRASGVIREAAAGQIPPESVLGQILGTGQRGREAGGLIQTAARGADATAHTTVTQAATDARMATWKTNGVNAFQFWAVLDERTTAGCALRHGLVYTLDTLQPIGHDVPLDRAPARHYRCRSILLPMAYDTDIPIPADGGRSTFRDYFDGLSEAEQERIFGVGRAQLFRDGVITQTDLVNQSGRLLTLRELREVSP